MKIRFLGNSGDVYSITNKRGPNSILITYKNMNFLINPGIDCCSHLIKMGLSPRKVDFILVTDDDLLNIADINTFAYIKSYNYFDPNGFLIIKRSIKNTTDKILKETYFSFEKIIAMEDDDNAEINDLELKAIESKSSTNRLNYLFSYDKTQILFVDGIESILDIKQNKMARKIDMIICSFKDCKNDDDSRKLLDEIDKLKPKIIIATQLRQDQFNNGIKKQIREKNINSTAEVLIAEIGTLIDLSNTL